MVHQIASLSVSVVMLNYREPGKWPAIAENSAIAPSRHPFSAAR
jgi:hypothetical protein